MSHFNVLLVAVDLSPATSAVVETAAKLAGDLGASIELLHVWEGRSFVGPEAFDEVAPTGSEGLAEFARSREGRWLGEILHDLRKRGLRVRGRLDGGRAADAIVRAADAANAGLIVIGTHGRRGLKRMMLGSVAEAVVRTSRRPVLTLPPHGAVGEESQ
jgi:nucleotide-binding universal stress UspA family protein